MTNQKTIHYSFTCPGMIITVKISTYCYCILIILATNHQLIQEEINMKCNQCFGFGFHALFRGESEISDTTIIGQHGKCSLYE